jgi:tight adherence protein B
MALLAAFSGAVLVAALWWFALLLWLRRKGAVRQKIEERLAPGAGGADGARTLRLWREGEEVTTETRVEAQALTLRDRLERLRNDAGVHTSVQSILLLLVLASLSAGVALYFLSGSFQPAVIGVVGVVFAAWWYGSKRVMKRRALFERQLVDGLELSARALRAGHPLQGAFDLIAQEIPAPLGTIFREICQQQEMGIRLDDALRRAALITGSPDMKLFSAALSIQLRAGGNLADTMEGIAFVVRERMRLNRRFRVLSAQTQFSKRVLLVMPFTMFALFSLLYSDYMRVLYTTSVGNTMLVFAAVSLLVGWIVMTRMAELKA